MQILALWIALIPTFGIWELLIILLIVMLLFGATQIPRLMRGMGEGIHEFKKGLGEGEKDAQASEEKKEEEGKKTEEAEKDKSS